MCVFNRLYSYNKKTYQLTTILNTYTGLPLGQEKSGNQEKSGKTLKNDKSQEKQGFLKKSQEKSGNLTKFKK